MGWRKWIVRGVVYGIIGAAVGAGVLYQRWTNPGAVREQVIAEIGKTFPGASVSVDSARLRILGGIELNGLRLSRLDDPEKHEFLHVPSAIFYHDKEKILDGQLKLRKIELHRPRLRVRRNRDGQWNLHDLTRPPQAPETAQPALVINEGTLILEDRSDPEKPTTLEINDVSLTLINDPLTHITIHGGGASELLGKLQLHGSLERSTGEAYLAFKAQQLPLTQNLSGRLPLTCPPDLFHGLLLSAMVNIDGKVSYHPGQPQPIYYDIHCDVSDGKLQHPRLPLTLEKMNVKFTCKNGELHLDKLTARSGATEISASGVAQLPCVDQSFEGQLELKHVMLGQDFSDRLPPRLRKLHELFAPRGPMTIKFDCARHEGQYVTLANGKPSRVSLQPEGIELCFSGFPYLLERTNGAIDYNLLNHRVDVDLTGYASGRPVFLNGNWTGENEQADVKFDIRANHVPINERLMQSLPTRPVNLQSLAESFHATGLIDVKAHIRHEPGAADWSNEFHIHIHNAGICWDQFSYSLKNVSGNIDIYPRHWEFHDFQGTNRDGHVMLNGRSWPTTDAKGEKAFGISLEITGRNVALDNQLRDALVKMPGLYKAWETFKPQGNLYFTAEVKRPTADINDLDVKVDARGASVKPIFMPYLVEEISGQFKFHKYKLDIDKLRAKHGETIIAMDKGYVDMDQRGGYYADLTDVQLRAFRIDDDFIRALPRDSKLPTAFTSLHMHGPDGQPCPLRVATRLVIAQAPETGKSPDIFWDGKAWMGGANLSAGFEFKNVTGEIACVGRWNGQILGVDGNLLVEQASLFDQPFKKVHAKFAMRDSSPDVLLMGLRAPVFGGDVVGQIRVDLNSALRYEMNLTASQINLAEFGRHNLGPKSQISGIANGRLYLHGFGTGLDTLDGHGSIDVPRGHFYNLPFLLDLLKFLGLHWPDRTAFEEFHTTFNIQGPKVNVQKVDLLGSAVSLSGKGEFDLASKNLKLDVFPMWGRIEQLVPQQVRPLPATISKNLITVEVRGPVTGNPKDIKYHMKPLPMIVDPILLMRDRVLGTENSKMPEMRVPGVDLSLPRIGENRYRIWE